MLPDYMDIRALTDREPEWFDGSGVPRYAPFSPDMLGVYDSFALHAEIVCQACATIIQVGEGWSKYDQYTNPIAFGEKTPWTLEYLVRNFRYADPPRHRNGYTGLEGGLQWCSGDTMNSIAYRVLGAWERVWNQGVGYEWVRDPAMEAVSLLPDWMTPEELEDRFRWREIRTDPDYEGRSRS